MFFKEQKERDQREAKKKAEEQLGDTSPTLDCVLYRFMEMIETAHGPAWRVAKELKDIAEEKTEAELSETVEFGIAMNAGIFKHTMLWGLIADLSQEKLASLLIMRMAGALNNIVADDLTIITAKLKSSDETIH